MNKSATLKIRVEPELKLQAMRHAKQTDISLSELLRRALLVELPSKGVTDGAEN